MRRHSLLGICATVLVMAAPAMADTLVSEADARRIGLHRYWALELPLSPGEAVTRIVLLDDELFAMTSANRALAVHAPTGILRWSRVVADEGLTVRGPSVTKNYVFFTTPASVRVFNRRTGEVLGEPRELRGVITEVASDVATLSIGEEHGVRVEDILSVYRATEDGNIQEGAIATVRINSIRSRMSKGKLVRMDSSFTPQAGDRVMAKVELPRPQVTLPFAASSAAVADDRHIYGGLANQRLYCIDILNGSMVWELMAPRTATAMPVLSGADLFFAGQDGVVTSCTKDERVKNWTFNTEAPIFDSPVVERTRVFVASSDRSVYCLDRASGKRLWRERFENPLLTSPQVAGDRVYQAVPQEGLFVLDAKTGKQLWQRTGGGQFLAEFGTNSYLFLDGEASQLVRVDAATGNDRGDMSAAARFGVGSDESGLMLLCDATGQLVCLRSVDSPPLKPAQLAEAFRDDDKAAKLAEAALLPKPAPKAEPTDANKLSSLLLDDDSLASRSTAKPVGGKSEVTRKLEADSAKKPAEPKPTAKGKPVKKEETDATSEEESSEEESDETSTASAPADEEASEEEASEEEDSATSDDEASSEKEAGEDDAESSEDEATTQESDEGKSDEETGDEDKKDDSKGDGESKKKDDKKNKGKPGNAAGG
jgi:outer membrane protein assembly factor BamB